MLASRIHTDSFVSSRSSDLTWAAPTLTSTLINVEPCAKMAVRRFLPSVQLISEGSCVYFASSNLCVVSILTFKLDNCPRSALHRNYRSAAAADVFRNHLKRAVLSLTSRLWRTSSPGSCRSRKCSSRWLEIRSALIPPRRVASPSSTRSPAFTPPASEGNISAQRCAQTHSVKAESLLPYLLSVSFWTVVSLSGGYLKKQAFTSAPPEWRISLFNLQSLFFYNYTVPVELACRSKQFVFIIYHPIS